ncbi:MobC family plasmid mobilization relaxosome protein [Paraburkholderia sp. CNPSo 3274]|uniref:plasmid mobilization protein n=1 Tax=Paraburkholderia sp. CNPSo 3274 TaxID=2940932 RepID=UPI0020B8398A|nr:plasmid mobilization relaxosome protein MobC [Paraburkholderia sp. CNPSo 3274]MCP3713132.1 MobC family plasmid mobilization relaxosome protein [Paraburkholderia sp. CNPSo 3274]
MPRGPRPFAETGQPLRAHRVSVYCTAYELATLAERAQAVHLRTPAYIRELALDRAPVTIPETNRAAVLELARVGNNLNQVARHLHTDGLEGIEVGQIRAVLLAVQLAVIGLKQ